MHEMKLEDYFFERMKLGYKTIEIRLNDEKRQKLEIGDQIRFTNIDTNEHMVVDIIDLYHYKDFYELYDHFDKVSIGYLEDEEADPNDMLKLYSKEEIAKYGVLAIEVVVNE